MADAFGGAGGNAALPPPGPMYSATISAQGGFGGAAPAEGQRRFINDIESYARLLEGARKAVAGLDDAVVGIAPHSLRAVTPESLRDVVAMAGEGPIHIHIAEQVKEVEDCLAWSGRRPVAWLTLDDLDNDPVILVRYLVAALGRIGPVDPSIATGHAASRDRILGAAMPRLVPWARRMSTPLSARRDAGGCRRCSA